MRDKLSYIKYNGHSDNELITIIIKQIKMQTIREKESPICSENSFLVETTFNSDIGLDIRKEIEKKYHSSRANRSYVFPRKGISGSQTKRRNISEVKPLTGNSKLEKSVPYVNAYQAYSREILSLKKLYLSH